MAQGGAQRKCGCICLVLLGGKQRKVNTMHGLLTFLKCLKYFKTVFLKILGCEGRWRLEDRGQKVLGRGWSCWLLGLVLSRGVRGKGNDPAEELRRRGQAAGSHSLETQELASGWCLAATWVGKGAKGKPLPEV